MRSITYIFLFLILISCDGEGKKAIKKPDNLIPKSKMTNIIYDMALLSAAKGVNRKHMEQKGVHPEKYVYVKYGIDSIQFAQSNEYYSYDLDAYEGIYNKVKERLEREKKEYTELSKAEKKELDSLNKERRKNRDSLKNGNDDDDMKLLNKTNLIKDETRTLNRSKNVDSLMKLKRREN